MKAAATLTSTTREPWLEHGRPALRCAESLGVDPAAFATGLGGTRRGMEKAFQDAEVRDAQVRGDQATVPVRLGGIPGSVDLEDEGQGIFSISTMPRE